MKKALTAIDCFSGCGGLTQGLIGAGFKVIAGVEIRKTAREAHHLNHPKARLYDDIAKVSGPELMFDLGISPGELDLLAGCPPCQGFSTMRTLNGRQRSRDSRNKLIFDFVRLACSVRPKAILMENVPALLTDWRLAEAKRRLKKAGFAWIKSGVLNAADFGVPQRRKRMILVASRLGPISLPQADSTAKVTVKMTIGRLGIPSESSSRLHKMYMRHSSKVMKRIKKIPHDGGSRRDLGVDLQLPCHSRIDGFKDVYGRMKWSDVAPTITRFCHNPSKGRFLHPEQNRALTIYEAMRLQTFPRKYKFPSQLCMGEMASLIGEAFPPKFAEAQARPIAEHLRLFSRAKDACGPKLTAPLDSVDK